MFAGIAMTSLCECPVCGGRLYGLLSPEHFIQNEIFCGTCGFTEPLIEAVARYEELKSLKGLVEISKPPILH